MFSELTESAAMGFSMVCVMLQAVDTTAEKKSYFIKFIIKAKVCKVEVCFKHSVEAYFFK